MNGNPRLDLDDNTYIEARFSGKNMTGLLKVATGEQQRRRDRMRNIVRPRIAILDSFIPNSFWNDHPDQVEAFARAIKKRKNGG